MSSLFYGTGGFIMFYFKATTPIPLPVEPEPYMGVTGKAAPSLHYSVQNVEGE